MSAHNPFEKFAIAYLIFSVIFFGAFFYDFYSTYTSTEPRCTHDHLTEYVHQMDAVSRIEYRQWNVSGGGIGIWGAAQSTRSNSEEIREAVLGVALITGCDAVTRDLVYGMKNSLLNHDKAQYMMYRNALVKVMD